MGCRLQDKVILITGGGSGIGQACCQRMAAEGAIVIASDINEAQAKVTADAIASNGNQAIALQQDVCSETDWNTVIGQIHEQFGRLDVLVNNAGIAHAGTAEDETLEGWRKIQAVNMEAVFLGTRVAIEAMKERGGSIVNISSIEGIIGEPMAAAYNASKGGVRISTKSAALHCASQHYNIRINSVHPGYVGTALVEDAVAAMDQATADEFMTRVMDSIPMQRLGEAEEIANVVLFVASDEASYMTGSELVVDGGYTAR